MPVNAAPQVPDLEAAADPSEWEKQKTKKDDDDDVDPVVAFMMSCLLEESEDEEEPAAEPEPEPEPEPEDEPAVEPEFNITTKSLRPLSRDAAAEAEKAQLMQKVAELERQLRESKMAKPMATMEEPRPLPMPAV